MSIGNYSKVKKGDKFKIDGVEWKVDEVKRPNDSDLPEHAEPQCFLVEKNGGKERQYTEQFLLNGAGIERL